MARKSNGEKRRLNLKLDSEVAEWAFVFAERHNTTITQLITDHFQELRRLEEAKLGEDAEQI